MQLAESIIPSGIPKKLYELAEEMMESKALRDIVPYTIELAEEEKRKLGIKFSSSILKALSNKTRLRILDKVAKGEYRSRSKHNYHLQILQEHGLITVEKNNFSVTAIGERIINSSIILLPYIKGDRKGEIGARRGEQNRILLHLLIAEKDKSFNDLWKELDLNSGSLYRSIKNLTDLGLILKDNSKYRVVNETSLEPLKQVCKEIITEVQESRVAMKQDGTVTIEASLKKFTRLPTTYDSKYLAPESVKNNHVIITYSYESEEKLEEIIRQIIYEQTRWKDDVCKPIWPEEANRIRIAYDIDKIASLQQLINFFCLHAIKSFDRLLVERMEVPKYFWKKFEFLKPKYGINGIRELLKIENRPILHVIIPQYLKTSEDTSAFVQELFEAGVDEVGDHQFMGTRLDEFRERIEKVVEVMETSSENFPHRMLFYPYIEGEDFIEKIEIVKNTKCKYLGLGLSPISFGIPATASVRKNYNSPLHLHLTLHGIYTRMGQSYYSKKGFRSGHGISMNVISKLFALVGGDEVNVDYYSLYSINPLEVKTQCNILQRFNVFPALVGGINLENLREILITHGKDIIIKIGGERFLEVSNEGEGIREFIGAYRELISKTLEGNFEDSENIKKWKNKERKIREKNQFLLW